MTDRESLEAKMREKKDEAASRETRGRALAARVQAALVAQGGPSIERESCLYRAPDGRRCAAGVLIADEHYHPRLESHGVTSPLVWAALLASGVDQDLRKLVMDLQHIHDVYDGKLHGDWADYLAREFVRVLDLPAWRCT